MPESVADLIKSDAVIWIAPAGEARPDETTVAHGAAWGGGWVKVGYTKEPLAVLYEFEEAELVVEQVLGPVERRKTEEHVTIETVLSELTALNLEYAAGMDGTNLVATAAGAAQKGYEELDVGNEPLMTKWAVGVEGFFVDTVSTKQPIRAFFDRMTLNINGELSFSKKDDDYSGIPFQGKGLANTASGGRMFTWQRVTAPVV